MQPMTIREIEAAVGGRLLTPGETFPPVSAVGTDSRQVEPGSLFVPWKGEKYDGHRFIDAALEAGAAGCLCAQVPEQLLPGKFYIQVPDTRLALRALAASCRDRYDIPVIQITGSVGKTTTKEMMAAVLGAKLRVLKTQGNFNNDIGTPLTLLNLGPEHQAAVVETGMNHFGEIRYLGQMVRPTIAVISNIGDAHVEFLGSREGILKAKCEIFENLKKDGLAVLNGDDELLNTVSLPQKTLRCGLSEHCDVRVSEVEDLGIDGIRCVVTTAKERYALSIPVPGKHMVYSAAMAAAIGEYLGETKEEIERGVAAYEPAGSRMHVITFSENRRLLDDCYNAGPQSMAASLRVLGASGGKKTAVIGDMAELGELTERAHKEIGELTKELGIDTVIAIGARAKYFTEGNPSAQWFRSVDEAIGAVKAAFTAETAMLVKASHSMHFEKIVEELTKA